MRKKRKKPDYFDDCALCLAMEESEKTGRVMTVSELKEGFRKMKQKGAVIEEDL